jgi:hypothetical protein
MSGRIPISDARKIGEQRGCPVVVIFAIHDNGERFALTTWGKTKRLCGWAASCGKDIHEAVMSGAVLDDARHADDPYAEIERLRAALGEIAHHGTDPPAAANYPDDVWWQKVAYDCMRIAHRALEGADVRS